jgi:hypothetical protein
LPKHRLTVATCAVVVLVAAGAWHRLHAAPDGPRAPSFLVVGECYAFTTPITLPGPLLLRRIDLDGWIEVELQAGAREGRRPYWLNLRSVISARATSCSP